MELLLSCPLNSLLYLDIAEVGSGSYEGRWTPVLKLFNLLPICPYKPRSITDGPAVPHRLSSVGMNQSPAPTKQTEAQQGRTIFSGPAVESGEAKFSSGLPARSIMALPLAIHLYVPYVCMF